MRNLLLKVLCVLLVLAPLQTIAQPDEQVQAYSIAPYNSNKILSEREGETRFGVAGLSKLPAILTICTAFDKALIDQDATLTVSERAAHVGGPTAFLERGEQIDVGSLLMAAVMISAGDAICALMEHAFGSEDVFLQNMNLLLSTCGVEQTMTDYLGTGTQFSCRELLLLGEAAVNSPTFCKYANLYTVTMAHADGRTTELTSANKMLRDYQGCFGLLTGSSNEDGYCAILACSRSDMTYLCAVVGAKSSKARFAAATELLDEAYANFKLTTISEDGVPIVFAYPVKDGSVETVDLVPHTSMTLLLNKSDGDPTEEFDLPAVLSPPLDPDLSVGSVRYLASDGTVLYEVALYPNAAVRSNGFGDILKRILLQFYGG